MARGKNPIESVKVTVSLTPQVFGILQTLAKSGFSARTEAAVAEEMIRKGLDADGLIAELIRTKIAEKKRGVR